jgi:hypothetical protein
MHRHLRIHDYPAIQAEGEQSAQRAGVIDELFSEDRYIARPEHQEGGTEYFQQGHVSVASIS